MTRLLVSVRNVEEAQIAIAEGVDLIDVKEPSRGALGAADPVTLKAIARCVAGRGLFTGAFACAGFACAITLARAISQG